MIKGGARRIPTSFRRVVPPRLFPVPSPATRLPVAPNQVHKGLDNIHILPDLGACPVLEKAYTLLFQPLECEVGVNVNSLLFIKKHCGEVLNEHPMIGNLILDIFLLDILNEEAKLGSRR